MCLARSYQGAPRQLAFQRVHKLGGLVPDPRRRLVRCTAAVRRGASAIWATGVPGAAARLAYLELVDDALHGRLRHQHVVRDSETLCGPPSWYARESAANKPPFSANHRCSRMPCPYPLEGVRVGGVKRGDQRLHDVVVGQPRLELAQVGDRRPHAGDAVGLDVFLRMG